MSTEQSIKDIIGQARDYAQESYKSAQDLIDTAQTAAQGVAYATPDLSDLGEIQFSEVPDLPKAPTFDASLEIPGDLPTMPDLATLSVSDLNDIPDPPEPLSTEDLFNHDVPVPLGGFDETPPNLDEITYPEAPDLDEVRSPDLREIPEVSDPDINVPDFTANEPDEPPAPPENLDSQYEALYDQMVPEMKAQVDGEAEKFIERFYPGATEQLNKLMERLNTYLEGGTGLPEKVEQGIYDRARDRTYQEVYQQENQAWEAASRRGFSVPPAILLNQLERVHQGAADRNAETAREIAKQQAELEQQNLQFAVSTAVQMQTQVRNGSIQYAQTLLQVNQQAMEYATQVLGHIVQTYNLAVQKYRTELEWEQTRIQLYEARIRSEMAKLEQFNAEVRYAEAVGQLNQLDLQKMAQELDVNANRVQLYAERMRAASTKLEQQKLQLDRFRSKIEAYDAEAQAKRSEFQAYQAAMEGDQAKVQAKSAEYDGYRSRVSGIQAQNEAEIQSQEALARNNQNLVEKYKGELTPYLTEVDVNKTDFQGKLEAYRASLERYQADVRSQISQLEAEVQTKAENAAHSRQLAQIKSDTGIANAKLGMDSIRVQTDSANQGAQLYANIAQAAVSAQNTMVQLASETITQATG
ncbi:hypothetical protein [Thiohalorhabdus sp.]|uniref:hypothetical protein n=1 Tax=Thiohalorhabdus sp. TaxID=3094134 RepID=UPI002FC29909